MQLLNRRISLPALTLLAALLVAGTAVAGDQGTNEGTMTEEPVVTASALTGTYTGVLVDPDVVFPRDLTHLFTVKLDRLTPPGELEQMVELLREKGQKALEAELWEKEVGRIQIDQSLGYPIAAAVHFTGDRDMGHLVLVIDRPMSIGEVFHATRSTEYPFSIIAIDLGQDGSMSGEMMVAAQMRFDGDDLVVRDLAFQPVRLLNVDHEPFGERRAAH